MFTKIRFAKGMYPAMLMAFVLSFHSYSQAPVSCPGFKTWTQGGYGGPGSGQPAQFLVANFAGAFPSGLEIGCTNKLRLTTATAVRKLLPQGTAPSYLPSGTLLNPTKTSYNSVLAGQLVTLTLNMRFDQVFGSFAPSSLNLKDLVITTGPFLGWTVQQFLADANKKIGACTTISTASYSDYANTADRINRAYDNGVSSGNFLACPLSITCSTTPATCFDGFSGSMTVTAAGGVPPYSIVSWSGGASGNFNGSLSATAGNLHAGTYTAVIKDQSQVQLSTTCTITEPPRLLLTISATPILCYGGTSIVTVFASGGTAPYNGVGTFTVLAGDYTYVVTDANGCETSVSIHIDQPSPLLAEINATPILCYGETSTITVTASGGTAPYSGVGTYTVPAGDYSYVVTDANGCETSVSIHIDQPSPLLAEISATPILCYGGTSTITVTASGGTAPFSGVGTYIVPAGDYSYEITDANGCQTSVSIHIDQPSPLLAEISATPILCYGGTSTITVTASGGTAPFSGVGTYIVPAGDYSYEITDANGCQTSVSIHIDQPSPLLAEISATPILCYGGTSTITVTASGGTAPYSGTGSYEVNAGNYCYIVTDANGCQNEVCISLTQPDPLSLNGASANPDCNVCNGTASVVASGGTGPYGYSWMINGSSVSNDQETIGNLCNDATVEVMVTDANGCHAAARFVLHVDCCQPLRTYTMGGWGAPASGCDESAITSLKADSSDGEAITGNSPAVQYLYANFAAAFPAGLMIGCDNQVLLTSACAVSRFLPSSGTSIFLPSGTQVDPSGYSNTLAGQICAATLAIVFDDYDSGFTASSETLGDRFIQSGMFAGMTVRELLEEANKAIGGCGSDYSLPDLNATVTAINENYDNGNGADNGFLSCSAPPLRISVPLQMEMFPNPAKESTVIKMDAKSGEVLLVEIADFVGHRIYESAYRALAGSNEWVIPLHGLKSGLYLVRVMKDQHSITRILRID